MVPAEPVRKEFSWKRPFVKAAGFGAGLALILCSVVGAWWWYSSRPKPPKPRNISAIRGSYYRVERIQENKDWRLNFEFILENTTDTDYELSKESTYRIAGKLLDTNSLTGFAENYQIFIKLPLFVPAHQKTRIDVALPQYDVDVPKPINASLEELHKHYDAVAQAVSEKMANLNGFMIFDENTRYQIDLPGDWKKEKHENKGTGDETAHPGEKKQ